MSQNSPVISPSDLAALIAKSQGRGFAPLTVPRAGDAAAGFRAASFAAPSVVPAATVEPVPEEAPRNVFAELAEARAQGFAEGLQQGRAAGLAEAEAAMGAEAAARAASAQEDLAHARALFLTATQALTTPAADQLASLGAILESAVRRLAAARAGVAIDAHPAAFITRIEAVADRVAQGLRAVAVSLHPADLAVVQAHLGEGQIDSITLGPDAALSRGDVVVRAQGVTLADVLQEAHP